MNESQDRNPGLSPGWILLPVVVLAVIFMPAIFAYPRNPDPAPGISAVTRHAEIQTSTPTPRPTMAIASTATTASTATPVVTATSTPTAVATSTAVPTFTARKQPAATLTSAPNRTKTPVRKPSLTATSVPKVAICHRTGSDQKPYTLLMVDERSLPTYRAQGDIIPAPATGCPARLTATPVPTHTPSFTPTATHPATATSTRTATVTPAPVRKVSICHATGSAVNPYNKIAIDASEMDTYSKKYPNDLIPSPPGGCPARVPTPAVSSGGANGSTTAPNSHTGTGDTGGK